MKEQLIKFLQNKQTTFTVNEVNQMIQIVQGLQEPKEEVKKKK